MIASATPPENAEKCCCGIHDQRIHRDAHHDRGHAVQHVCSKPDRIAQQAAPAELRKVNAGRNPDWECPCKLASRQHHPRTHDRVRHAPSRLSHRGWALDEESSGSASSHPCRADKPGSPPAAESPAAVASIASAGYQVIHNLPRGVVHPHAPRRKVHRRTRCRWNHRVGPHAKPPSPVRRASPPTPAPARIRSPQSSPGTAPSPISISALRYKSSVASENSFAITLASVLPGANRLLLITAWFPIVIATAIVSPSARPSPRMTAPTIPMRALRSTPDANHLPASRTQAPAQPRADGSAPPSSCRA